ncbi:MAG: cation transporter [Gemmatimonadota bacterium]|nr:cation transporter [Gemmatimonadota bacterium]MDH5198997.1 cation transporter [Gemmatimonadota bacterium]
MTDRSTWTRVALRLVAVTAAYNAVEAVVALWAGVTADSVALMGFGFDSAIELAASLAVLSRMRLEADGAAAATLARAERRVRRFVGWTFVVLAGYVVIEAGLGLWRRDAPQESMLGIALAVVSLVAMPLLAWGKFRAAAMLGSRALAAEANETLACAYLSGCLLVGLGLNAAVGWWWADAVAALAMVPWLLHEAREAMEDDPCP